VAVNTEIEISFRSQLSAYVFFALFCAAYFLYYLPQGFSLFDDAYLLGLATRIVDGETPYVDFYFLRTPLSIYIQAGIVKVFGDSYTVLWSRVYWAVQLSGMIVISSLMYRKYLPAALLSVCLCASLVYSSLLFSFPWYTYDGMFFVVVSAYFIWRKRYVYSGASAALAVFCKQGFLVFGPAFFVLWLIAALLKKEPLTNWRNSATSFGLGWTLMALVGLVALLVNGQLISFWENAFLLPAKVHPLPLTFVFLQTLPMVLADHWPMIGLYGLTLTVRSPRWVTGALLILLTGFYWKDLTHHWMNLQYLITPLAYITLLVAVFRATRNAGAWSNIVVLSLLGVSAAYAASFNYDGLIFSYIAGPITLPALVIILFMNLDGGEALKRGIFATWKSGIFSKWPIALTVSATALIISLLVHHRFPYMENPREFLTVEFQTPKLSGLKSSAVQVGFIDSLTSYVTERTSAEDVLFGFPDLTPLNYLTGRRAWGRTHWHFPLEYNLEMALVTADLIKSDPPDLTVLRVFDDNVDKYKAPYAYVQSGKERIILDALLENMAIVDSIGPFYILRPRAEAQNEGP